MVVAVSDREFADYVAARAPSLLRFGYLVTGSEDAAHDAVQSALTSAWGRWEQISSGGDPDRYLRRAVVNAHISAWRRFRRRESPVAEVAATSAAPDGGLARPDPTGDPAEAVIRHDAVWRVCRALPDRQRAAVVLRFYEDCDYAEIATILGCTEATVRSHVHRGLAALRAELIRQEAENG